MCPKPTEETLNLRLRLNRDMGVDIVVESVTKFINGHSDVVAGLAAINNEAIYNQLKLFQKNFGAIVGVEDA